MRHFPALPVILCILLFPRLSTAQDTASQTQAIAKLEKEISALESQIKANDRQKASELSTLTLVQKKVSARRKLIKENERQIASLDGDIRVKQQEIKTLSNRLDTLSVYYARLVKGAYRNRDYRLWYLYILSGENLAQSVRRFAYLRNLSVRMNEQAAKIRETRSELEEQQAQIVVMRDEMGQLKKEHEAALGQLNAEEAHSRRIIDNLQRDKNKYKKEIGAKRRQVDALNREIARIIEQTMAADKKKGAKQPVDYTLSGEFAANRGKLPWPSDGIVVEHFGKHRHSVYTDIEMPPCNGVTIATAHVAPVWSVFDGVVRRVGVQPGYKLCVLVQHGSYYTFYCKLGAVNVKAGQKIKTGDLIGTVDTIAGETQLHFQLWEGRSLQNPEEWLRGR
ncbi:MAG: peptidoglycan DD-metalloendopeptidase family protein [Bacteroidales bacterium]|nr:peptidoglycan DD-metalloendopeptidase family protein [Bacteroidales bacterium]